MGMSIVWVLYSSAHQTCILDLLLLLSSEYKESTQKIKGLRRDGGKGGGGFFGGISYLFLYHIIIYLIRYLR